MHRDTSFWQQSRDLINVITALNSNRLTKQMDSCIALVTQEFFIRLLKRLRYDVLDVWLHESLKLMKRVAQCPGHNQDCSSAKPPLELTGSTRWEQTKRTQSKQRTAMFKTKEGQRDVTFQKA